MESASFTVEKDFLNSNPDLVAPLSLEISNDVKFWMNRRRDTFELENRDGIKVCLVSLDHLEVIERFQVDVFDNPYDEALRYARAGIEGDNSLLYIVLKDDEIIASCRVDMSTGENYLFGLAVKNTMQGQEIGTYMTKWIINDRIKNDNRPFQIAVEGDNSVAKRLY